MTIDSVQPALGIQALHPKQEGSGQSGREPRGDDKPKQRGPRRQEQDPLFLNSLGQVTGKTINITA